MSTRSVFQEEGRFVFPPRKYGLEMSQKISTLLVVHVEQMFACGILLINKLVKKEVMPLGLVNDESMMTNKY